jgi:hypothetical protein
LDGHTPMIPAMICRRIARGVCLWTVHSFPDRSPAA